MMNENIALDPVGFARFFQQFNKGSGDYTKEKYLVPEPSMEKLVAELVQEPDEWRGNFHGE